METDFWEVGLCHLEEVSALGKEYVATIFVFCHVLEFATFEVFEFGLVVRLNPAGFVERHRFPTTLCAILVEEAVFDNFELELAYSTDDFAVVILVSEHLSHTFAHELVDTFLKLFCLHWVGILDIFEHLW